MEKVPFLREEFASMVEKGQWVVLLYSVAKDLPGLRMIPPGAKEERYRRPRWLGDDSFSNLNSKILPITAMYAMKYGRALDRLIREVVIDDP